MTVLLASAPGPVDLPPLWVDPWTSCTHRWTSGDLSWDLTGNDRGRSLSGIFLMPGVRGMNMPPIQHHRRKSASVAGSLWRGFTTDERDVFWPLEIYAHAGSQAWIDYNRSFWSTMRPDRTGVWSVTQPGDGSTEGETRNLTLRFENDGDPAEDIAPELMGWAEYGITMKAEQPHWAGPPITRFWDQSGGLVNYYGGGPVDQPGLGPPFVTTPGRSMATARISNPGDVAGLPIWTITGPCTTVQLGVGDRLISVPFGLQAGEWLRIDTARTDRRAMFGTGIPMPGVGVNRTRDLGASTRFGEVPPGQSVPLSIAMDGAGRVDMQLIPLYYMAR
ncbi:hypothetical protein GCM10009616_35700 [Microlunatus lacustris]